MNGSVCAISGDYIDHVVDLVIPGPTPLILQRTYRSSDYFSGHLYKSWKLSEPNQLEITSDLSGAHRSDFYASVTTAQGAKARYHKYLKNTTEDKEEFEFSRNKGFTNCGHGIIGGKTNLKNNRLYVQAVKAKKGSIKASLVAGDGQKRKYIYHYSDDAGIAHCELLTEELRNNTRKHFFYDSGAFIKSIHNKNWQENLEYGSFYFDRDRINKDQSIKIQSSLGFQVLYHFLIDSYKDKSKQSKYTRAYIDAVANPTKPFEKYRYKESARTDNHLMLVEKALPNGRVKQIEYYENGKNYLAKNKITISEKDDLRLDRVKRIKAPIDQNSPIPITTHEFIYHINKDKNNKIISGATEVFDAHNNRTIYYYNKDFRLTELVKCAGFDDVKVKEKFYWGEKNTPDDGNILATTTIDANHQIKAAKVFYYDKKGNVTKLREYGVITGLNNNPIQIGEDGRALDNGAEYVSKKFNYDNKNRLTCEQFVNGKSIFYEYLGDSNLITKKQIADPSLKIISREFNYYNADYFLIAKSIDEGEGSSQKIYRYTPRMAAPFGLLQVIDEFYVEGGQEKLLHRTINHHTANGHLVAEEHVDSLGNFSHVLRWEYDTHGNVTKERMLLVKLL